MGRDHFALLFVSALATDAELGAVADIARSARANNARTDITGLLVFDGRRFAQVMEGPKEAVLIAAGLMQEDPRHRDMEVLYAAAVDRPRRYPTWRLGYLVMDLQEFGLQSLRGLRGPAALDAFNFMLPALDMAMGEAVSGDARPRSTGKLGIRCRITSSHFSTRHDPYSQLIATACPSAHSTAYVSVAGALPMRTGLGAL